MFLVKKVRNDRTHYLVVPDDIISRLKIWGIVANEILVTLCFCFAQTRRRRVVDPTLNR